MSHRSKHIHRLRSLASSLFACTSSKSNSHHRRIRLEQLEPRYALTAPVANGDQYYMHPLDTLVISPPGVLANDSDFELDSLTAIQQSSPNDGVLIFNSDGGFTYTNTISDPLDFFNYRAVAIDGTSNIAQVVINIGNQLPVANEDQLAVEKNTTTIIDVLDNDSDAEGDTLTVSHINNALATVGVSVPVLNGSVTLNSDQTISFVPTPGFDGLALFTYKLNDGFGGTSANGNVLIDVLPIADAGGSYFISEGQELELAGSAVGDIVTYSWYVDQIAGPHEPALGQPVLIGQNQTFSWPQLNASGITSHTNAFVTLKVVDQAGQISYDQADLTVGEVPTEVLSMTVTPAAGACAGNTVELMATFTSANPFDTNFTVSVDWNWDIFDTEPGGPVPEETLSFTPNGDGTYSVAAIVPTSAITHDYGPAGGTFLPTIIITQDDGDLMFGNTLDFFIDVPPAGSGGGAPSAAIDNAPSGGSEGTLIHLTSTATPSCDGTLTYEWDVSKNGVPGFATSTNPADSTFDFTPDDNGSYIVSLTVTEGAQSTTVSSDAIIVTNVAPTIGSLNVAQLEIGSPEVTLNGSFTDPGLGDTFTVEVVWETGGTPQSIPVVGSGGTYTFAASHEYTSTGAKPISVTVSDDDTGSDNDNSSSVTVQAALALDGSLAVLGLGASDVITLSTGSVIVTINGIVVGEFEEEECTGSITIHGGDGDDTISAAGISRPVIIFGGAGHDVIKGGSGQDVIYGGDGDDHIKGGDGADILIGDAGMDFLTGGSGRDILIGGDHADKIHGNDEDDIIVSGIVSFSGNLDALSDIRDVWVSNDSFIARTGIIEGCISSSLTHHLNSATVFDDDDKDTLAGDQGVDWFFANLWLDGDDDGTKDKMLDVTLFELCFANDLDL